MVKDVFNQRVKFKEAELNKSAGILDDFSVRKNVATKEGTIEHIPTQDNHIVNKKYVDDFFSVVEEKTDNYAVQLTDHRKTLVMNINAEKTFSLPSVDASNVGIWFTFVKVNTGKLIIDAADNDIIADSTAGATIYNEQTNETYATLTLRLVTATKWVILHSHGSWVTT